MTVSPKGDGCHENYAATRTEYLKSPSGGKYASCDFKVPNFQSSDSKGLEAGFHGTVSLKWKDPGQEGIQTLYPQTEPAAFH